MDIFFSLLQVHFTMCLCFSKLSEEQFEDAYMKLLITLAATCSVDSLQGLEQKAIARRAEVMACMQKQIANMSEEDRAALMEEIAVLEKVGKEQKR